MTLACKPFEEGFDRKKMVDNESDRVRHEKCGTDPSEAEDRGFPKKLTPVIE